MMPPQAVYVMSVPSGYRKIGIAIDPNARRMALQGAAHETITLEYTAHISSSRITPMNMEREIHRRLGHRRVKGEWFQISLDEIEVAFTEAWSHLIQSSRGGGESRPAGKIGKPRQDLGDGAGVPETVSHRPVSAGVAPGPRETKRGRRIAGEAHLALRQAKPWLAAGMSRATWYRRRK